MMKQINKGLAVLLILFVAIFTMNVNVFAQDAVNVSVSSAETTVGKEVEVTITLDGNKGAIEMVDLWIQYDSTVIEAVSGYDQGGGGKVRVLSTSGGSTYTVKFKGLAAGSCNIGIVTGQSIVSTPQADNNRAEIYTTTGTVTVKGAVNQSKNNNLSALMVSPGTLTPAFSKDVTTYNMTLNEYVNRLTVSATPEDAKAKISVWGAAMDPGDNTTKITVTAENGDQKVYTIYTKVPAKPQEETKKEESLIIDINGKLYNVVNNFEESLLPEGYEASDYTYKKSKIVVGKGLSNGKIIFCVTNADVEKAEPQFVVYDEQTGTFSHLRIITTSGASYTIIEDVNVLNSVEVPKGFVESEYSFNDIIYKVWVEEGNSAAEYFIIYCTNINGETGWYQYDMTEGTMQRAFLTGNIVAEEETSAPAVEETQSVPEVSDTTEMSELKQEYEDYMKKTKLAMALMAFLLVAIVIVVVVFAIKSFRDPYGDEDEEESYREAVSKAEKRDRKREAERTVKRSEKATEKSKKKEYDEYEEYEEIEEDTEDDDDDINFLS